MLDFIERLDIYERECISARYRARVHECVMCGDIPDEGAIINDVVYCPSCAKQYVLDKYGVAELIEYFDTIFDENDSENKVIEFIQNMPIDDFCDAFAGFGFEHWEY